MARHNKKILFSGPLLQGIGKLLIISLCEYFIFIDIDRFIIFAYPTR